jgi:putative oxidoreductase
MLQRYEAFMTPEREALLRDAGLLILRLGVGLMMAFSHGLGKIQKLFAGGPYQWADPIGLGPGLSLALAGSAEFLGALMIALGLGTRIAAGPLAFTMLVAAFIVHADDPFKKKEFALLYLIPCLTLLLAGPGRWSFDALIRRARAKK